MNPTIDWVFYSDCGEFANQPSNVRLVEISYDDYCQQVSSILEIDFSPPDPYKLCDIKPALGYIHADAIEGYDFWAFGDIDVIYGDLRSYFTPERLEGRWLLSTHHRRVSGHLCLIRNNASMRSWFKKIPDWQNRFVDPQHHALDEGAFSRLFVRHKNLPDKWRHYLCQLYPAYRHSEFVESHSTFTLWPDGRKTQADCWEWRSGHLYNSDFAERELPYLHFLHWKKGPWAALPASALQSDERFVDAADWRITARGIHGA